jgi:conserved oligomeric Golgi complex subunit 1
MAAALPDTGLLTSSAQIFASNHTLPQIRAIHKALRAQIDEKGARLRTQVGGSYRELLGTADAIVNMRDGMAAVQERLSGMGGRCGRGVVGSKVAGLARFAREAENLNEERGTGCGFVARARLLEGCSLVVGKALRTDDSVIGRGERLVLAAKALVLSRLLLKSIGEDANVDAGVRASAETSKAGLGGLRRKLLRSIEKVLKHVGEGASRDDVLKALCAYSLATSSGTKDVLRHLLHVRGEAMALAFEIEESDRERSSKDVVKALRLYTDTLLDVQALVPNKLTDALAGLKRNALLADETLRRSEGLRLDIYGRWCGEDIQYFKPYIRHDDLDGQQAKDMLLGWADKGGEVLMKGLEKTLERQFEFGAIVEMRTTVLQLWIREGGKARGFDQSVMLDKLRGAINRHLLQVLTMKVSKLRLVGSEIAATLQSWQPGVTDEHKGLWDGGDLDLDVGDEASPFTHRVISRLYGRSDAVSKAITCYNSWRHVIDDVGQVVEQLRRQRWTNDVDEIEDEETIEQRQHLLSRGDSQALHNRLNASLEKAFDELDTQLAAEWKSQQAAAFAGPVAMYFARVLRDIRARLPQLDAVQNFGLAVVPSIHEAIAAAVAVDPLQGFSTVALSRKTVAGRGLWEGDPCFPVSPSPGAFKFLRDLSMAMSDAGADLWSPTAVTVLKQHVGNRLSDLWLEVLAARSQDEVPISNGVVDSQDGAEKGGQDADLAGEDKATLSPEKEQNRDVMVQWLFDVSFLQCCLDLPHSNSKAMLHELGDAVYNRSELGDDAIRQQLGKMARDYWKRTSLLFGLLT